jgi:hypothetical protein
MKLKKRIAAMGAAVMIMASMSAIGASAYQASYEDSYRIILAYTSYTPSGWKNGTLSKGQLLKATTTHNRNTSYKYSARTLVMKDNRVFKDIQSDY